MKSKNEVSAGGVVFRFDTKNLPQVLICKHSGYHKWVLPKGHVEADETLEQTAQREVSEEVGVHATVLQPIAEPEKYIYILNNERIFKTVHYFLMRYDSGNEQDHDFEMEDVRWVSFEEAIDLVAFEGAKNILSEAQKLLKKIK